MRNKLRLNRQVSKCKNKMKKQRITILDKLEYLESKRKEIIINK